MSRRKNHVVIVHSPHRLSGVIIMRPKVFLLLLCCVPFLGSFANGSETVFQIGFPDGKCAEFRHGVNYEEHVKSGDSIVCRYEVGKSRPRDWFRWHNSTRERILDSLGHSFAGLITFDSPHDFSQPLYLVIGTCYGHATEPSLINVKVNGTDIDPVRVKPGPTGFPKFNQDQYGWPETNVVPIPGGLIKAGKNELQIRLTDGSWSIYDYIILKDSPDPLPIVQTEELLNTFRAPGGPMENVKEILFAVRQPSYDGHWYANFGYYACSIKEHPFPLGGGGALRILNLDTGKVRTIFEDKNGNVRDPQIHYDGKKAVFSYLKGGTEHYNLYEINLDGTGLRQITSGEWDDIEPTYLPNGDIVFPSSRGKRWVQCWLTGVAMLHRCGSNGENIHLISSNPEQENTPWVLPNGQLIYMRWEYIDRSQVHYHHLWTSNPDGTKHQAYFGNQHAGICMLGAKPVLYRPDVKPQQQKYPVVCTFSPGHGRREHYGAITLVDPRNGPDDMDSTRTISLHNDHADPWAFSDNAFIAARQSRLQAVDGEGRETTIYQLPQEEVDANFWIADPQPILPRLREPIIADTADQNQAPDEMGQQHGRIAMADIYTGKQLKSIKRGSIKELLILEPLPIPVHYNGGMMSVSEGGTFALERIIGTVPVNPDGSAYMELPANRSFLFVAMDYNGKPVKRMHSFTTVMPGENATCIGCHEERTAAPTPANQMHLIKAMKAAPARPQKVEGIPEVFDYMRDIRPIIDQNCLECHNENRADGGWDLNSDLYANASFVRSYVLLSARDGGYWGDNRNRPVSDFAPYEIGSCASKLVQLIESGHPDKDGKKRVNMPADQQKRIRYWIDAGANYCGTYAADACGLLSWGYTPFLPQTGERHEPMRMDVQWPECKAMQDVFQRRCIECHKGDRHLPDSLTGGSRYSASWTVNLSYPEKSRLLLAALAVQAGGNNRCFRTDDTGKHIHEPVFQDKNDPDYQTILACILRGKRFITEEQTHFSLTPFVPNPWYAREMIRFGILPQDYQIGTPIDPYETDQKYWKSLWR